MAFEVGELDAGHLFLAVTVIAQSGTKTLRL